MDSSSHPWESYFGIPTISFFFLAKIRKEAQATSVKIRLLEFMRLVSLIKISSGYFRKFVFCQNYQNTKNRLQDFHFYEGWKAHTPHTQSTKQSLTWLHNFLKQKYKMNFHLLNALWFLFSYTFKTFFISWLTQLVSHLKFQLEEKILKPFQHSWIFWLHN